MIVKVYKWNIWSGPCFENHITCFSYSPWPGDTSEIIGNDDGGRDYIVPDGLHFAEAVDGNIYLYDNNVAFELIGDDQPCLVGPGIIYELKGVA